MMMPSVEPMSVDTEETLTGEGYRLVSDEHQILEAATSWVKKLNVRGIENIALVKIGDNCYDVWIGYTSRTRNYTNEEAIAR